MFRPVDVSVDVGETIVFRFAPPLSVITLLVANAAEEILWDFIAAEYEPVEVVEGGSLQTWPIDEAPPELLAMLETMQKRADRELAEHGPRKPALTQVTYGALPPDIANGSLRRRCLRASTTCRSSVSKDREARDFKFADFSNGNAKCRRYQ